MSLSRSDARGRRRHGAHRRADDVHGSFQGTARAFQASLDSQPWLILAALLAVYIVLGMLYESLVHPITILSTLPSAGVGALLALLAFRTEFSIIALIGVILLIGIVKKNAIMMIDFALDAERSQGLRPEQAIFEACLLRFRPIMMTTMAALLGALPLALGLGEGAELRRPLGIAIVGGLVLSQMLTLYTTPVVYLYLDRFRLWCQRRWRPAGAGTQRCELEPTMKHAGVLVSARRRCGALRRLHGRAGLRAAERRDAGGVQGSRGDWKPAEPRDDAERAASGGRSSATRAQRAAEQVDVSNQNVLAAEAQYRQAQALVQQARAGLFPDARRPAPRPRAASRRSLANSRRSPPVAVHHLQRCRSSASWAPDLWGSIRRTVEASEAGAAGERRRPRGGAAFGAGAARAELLPAARRRRAAAAARGHGCRLRANRSSSRRTATRRASPPRSTWCRRRRSCKSTQAQAIDIGVQRAQLEHAIAMLIGKPPSEFSIAPSPLERDAAGHPARRCPRSCSSAGPTLPPPSAAWQRRTRRSASPRRRFFPTLTLSGAGGFQSTSYGRLAHGAEPLLVARRRARADAVRRRPARARMTDQAIAAYDANVAAYRQTVLTGFQQVEDNLAALRILEQEAEVQDEAVRGARQSLALPRNQYKAGTVSYLNVVVAQAAALNNEGPR